MPESQSSSPLLGANYPRRDFIRQMCAAGAAAFSGISLPALHGVTATNEIGNRAIAKTSNLVAALYKNNPYCFANILFEELDDFLEEPPNTYRTPFQRSAFRFTYWVKDSLQALAEESNEALPSRDTARTIAAALADEKTRVQLATCDNVWRNFLHEEYYGWKPEELPPRAELLKELLEDLAGTGRGLAQYSATDASALTRLLGTATKLFPEGTPCLGLDILKALHNQELHTFISKGISKELWQYYKDGDDILRCMITRGECSKEIARIDALADKFRARGIAVPDWRAEARDAAAIIDTGVADSRRELEKRIWQSEGCFDGITQLRERLEWQEKLAATPLRSQFMRA